MTLGLYLTCQENNMLKTIEFVPAQFEKKHFKVSGHVVSNLSNMLDTCKNFDSVVFYKNNQTRMNDHLFKSLILGRLLLLDAEHSHTFYFKSKADAMVFTLKYSQYFK